MGRTAKTIGAFGWLSGALSIKRLAQPTRLKLIAFTQQQKSVCADIETSGTTRVVSPVLAASLISLRPQIIHHACHSKGTGLFGDCISGALLPHAVEHLAIDLLAERFSASDAHTFAGATTWIDRDSARMRVRVGCTDSTPSEYFSVTEAALTEAVRLMNQLLEGDKPCD